MRFRLFVFGLLANFFEWLEWFAQHMYNLTNLCSSCGKPAYFTKSCLTGESK